MNTYRGLVRYDGTFVVSKNHRILTQARSLRVRNHSPDGFAWGYCGSGPAQLALALLLAEGVEEELALALYQAFKEEVIAPLPNEAGAEWILDAATIHGWVAGEMALRCIRKTDRERGV